MDQVTPEWLNEAFLSHCLQGKDAKASPVIVKSYNVNAGVAPGNNYGSVILRVTVTYQEGNNNREKSSSLIVKGPVSNSAVDAIAELFGLTTEYEFYYLYLPKMYDIIKEHITAMAYLTPMKSVVVLQDLKEAGFTMADRLKQLDFDHSKQYFIASAKFHAAGVFMARKNPELLDNFPGIFDKMVKSGDFSQMNKYMHDILIGFKCLVKSIETLGLVEYKPHIDKIKTFIAFNTNNDEEIMSLIMQGIAEKNSKMFKSFIHGDCWTTNMMFKHDKSGKPIDIRVVDFQLFRYDTVFSDIVHFTWMSCNNQVLENHLDELYNIYCDTLNSKLAEFGCPERLFVEQLKEEICENSLQILSLVCMWLPLTQHDEPLDLTRMFTGQITEEDMVKYYQGENFFRKFPHVLKFVANQGIFDSMEKSFLQLELYKEQLNSSKLNQV